MSALIDRFVVWGQQLVEAIGYVGLAIIMFAENVFPPIPSEPFLLGAGFSSGRGDLSLPLSVLAATAGALVGATLYYWIGVVLPEPRLRRLLRDHGKWLLLGEDDLDRSLRWFRRHGQLVVFFGRCIPLVRTLISVPAGMTRMPLPRFLLYSALGTATWSTLLIVVGRLLGENYDAALGFFDRYEQVFYVVVALAVVAFVVTRLRRRRRGGGNDGNDGNDGGNDGRAPERADRGGQGGRLGRSRTEDGRWIV